MCWGEQKINTCTACSHQEIRPTRWFGCQYGNTNLGTCPDTLLLQRPTSNVCETCSAEWRIASTLDAAPKDEPSNVPPPPSYDTSDSKTLCSGTLTLPYIVAGALRRSTPHNSTTSAITTITNDSEGHLPSFEEAMQDSAPPPGYHGIWALQASPSPIPQLPGHRLHAAESRLAFLQHGLNPLLRRLQRMRRTIVPDSHTSKTYFYLLNAISTLISEHEEICNRMSELEDEFSHMTSTSRRNGSGGGGGVFLQRLRFVEHALDEEWIRVVAEDEDNDPAVVVDRFERFVAHMEGYG